MSSTASPALLLDRGPVWWPFSEIQAARGSARLRRLVGIWLVLVLASVAFGVLNVWLDWNGIALSIGGIPFEVTIFPPFLFSVLIALWLGPTWAAIPIYLANLASALASGLPFPLAALFAVAGVMETLMLWASLVAVRVDPDLRRGRDLAWFAGAGLVAAVTGSLAAILWNSAAAAPRRPRRALVAPRRRRRPNRGRGPRPRRRSGSTRTATSDAQSIRVSITPATANRAANGKSRPEARALARLAR